MFVREFYVQFFAVIGMTITSIGFDSGTQANLLMRSMRRRKPRGWQQSCSLIRRFLHLSKIYLELLGEQYAESSDAISNFQRQFVSEMLDEISAWALEFKYSGLHDAAVKAKRVLRNAIEEVAG